jgi:hypothetical protein
MVSWGTETQQKNCFLTTDHSSFMVHWWVLDQCGGTYVCRCGDSKYKELDRSWECFENEDEESSNPATMITCSRLASKHQWPLCHGLPILKLH